MLASVRSERWLIRYDRLQSFALSMIEFTEKGLPETKSELSIGIEDFYDSRAPAQIIDGVGVIQIKGVLLDQSPAIYEKLGYVTRYSTIQNEIEQLVESGAQGILFQTNSPGGTVSGCIETATAIKAIEIPTASFCEGMACSAAYKLASSTGTILATPSAEVGNIGTILSWADCSEFWANMGIEMKALTSEGADLKSTFHLEPNEEQIDFLQESINEAGKNFREWVSSNRPDIDPEVFRAGWYSGDRAEALGLIDGQADLRQAIALLKFTDSDAT